jgi:excinuclease ABC subunit A
MTDERNKIIIRGARVHNLKNISLEIPKNRLVVITGLSGSGKSSLAFDTIYAEGQRRYVESLSAYARQFLEQMQKPDVESIEGLSPAISVEQKSGSKNPRSTVGTITEIYDYLRVLFARAGTPFCYQCEKQISSQTIQEMVDRIMEFSPNTKLIIFAPVVRGRKGEFKKELEHLQKEGFVRVRIDGAMQELPDPVHPDKNISHTIEVVIDRLVVKAGIEKRLADSLQTAAQLGQGIVLIAPVDGKELFLNERSACVNCGVSYPEITPRTFSFNSPYGACPACLGLGTKMVFDPDRIVPNPDLSLQDGAVLPWAKRESSFFRQMLDALAQHYQFSINTPFRKLPSPVQEAILFGSGNEKIQFEYADGERRFEFKKAFEGVIGNLERRYRETNSDVIREEIEFYMNQLTCPECQGKRLRRESLHIKINGKSIHDFVTMTVEAALDFLDQLQLTGRKHAIAGPLIKEIRERLTFLANVGVEYLTLERTAATLSGGEAQRIRLATQIGSGLSGVLYVLDEPSVGLHARDTARLIATLKRLRDLGNTVIVVEHDEHTIRASDYVVDMGPGAGVTGGEVVATGAPAAIIKNKKSLTGQYLSGSKSIPVPASRRKPGKKALVIKAAAENNLKHVDVTFPLGLFICITGVSGSGKSTLLLDTLYPALAQRLYRGKERVGKHKSISGIEFIDKVINIDQSPIGRTPRSNPATYTGVFTDIRDLFAMLPESKMRGYKPGRYSFNVKGGRCEACQGDGVVKIEMHFLPDLYVTCDVCRGMRYNRETLEVHYRGKSIADVLEMTVQQAYEFFENIPAVRNKLQTLRDVGLDYITLGQQATTLSGGEAQRVKLSRELSKRGTGKTLYILDEPTTGLHFADIEKLLEVLNSLVDRGNTVMVIEHNMEVIKTADYIIDLGPEGGDRGGQVVAIGSPEDVARVKNSYTGQYLKKVLSNS